MNESTHEDVVVVGALVVGFLFGDLVGESVVGFFVYKCIKMLVTPVNAYNHG